MSNTLRKVFTPSFFFISSCLFWLLNSCSFSSKEYFTTKGENRFTAQQMEAKRKALEKQLSKQIMSNFAVEIELLDSFKVGDSLIKKARFKVVNLAQSEVKSRAALSALIGTTFPVKELTLLHGNSIQLADLKGKPSLVNFWFTRCAPCLDEVPVFNRLVKEHQNAFHFLAISFEKASTVERFLNKQPFDFVHAVEAKAFIDSLQLSAYPTTLLLDRHGIIREVRGGLPYRFGTNGALKIGDGAELVRLLKEFE
jgi:cytochrome c biogenesis protein CcmG, thiol:disulfide interchange protein DsbE